MKIDRERLSTFGRANSFSAAIYTQAPLGAATEVSCSEVRLFVQRSAKATKTGGY